MEEQSEAEIAMTRSKPAETAWQVLRNHEGRYSLTPLHHGAPAGWQPQGEPASKADCLERIATLWTDMRPDSLKGDAA